MISVRVLEPFPDVLGAWGIGVLDRSATLWTDPRHFATDPKHVGTDPYQECHGDAGDAGVPARNP